LPKIFLIMSLVDQSHRVTLCYVLSFTVDTSFEVTYMLCLILGSDYYLKCIIDRVSAYLLLCLFCRMLEKVQLPILTSFVMAKVM